MILLFDLDGTLTDPRVGICASARHALGHLGVEAPGDDVLASFIGPPLRGMFRALLGSDDGPRVEEAVRLYRERYRDVGIHQTRMYDGIPPLLERASAFADRILLATSKPWMFAERILENHGIARHFSGVYGPELDGRRDDKGELLMHLIEREGIVPRESFMIGDRAADVVAARANGVCPVGVLWGYGTTEELLGAGATTLFATPTELGNRLPSLGHPSVPTDA